MAARPRKRSQAHSAAHKRKLRYVVGPASEIKPGESRKFMLPIEGADEECFVITCAAEVFTPTSTAAATYRSLM